MGWPFLRWPCLGWIGNARGLNVAELPPPSPSPSTRNLRTSIRASFISLPFSLPSARCHPLVPHILPAPYFSCHPLAPPPPPLFLTHLQMNPFEPLLPRSPLPHPAPHRCSPQLRSPRRHQRGRRGPLIPTTIPTAGTIPCSMSGECVGGHWCDVCPANVMREHQAESMAVCGQPLLPLHTLPYPPPPPRTQCTRKRPNFNLPQ